MKKTILALFFALLLLPASALAEEIIPNPEGWIYTGYTPGGITFLVPEDIEIWNLDPLYTLMGYCLVGSNAHFTLQLRSFAPENMTMELFTAQIMEESTAQVHIRQTAEGDILCYRNTAPTANSELYGVVLTGLDGIMYKISIFTGDDNAFGPDAKVWEIAEIIAESVRWQDFSQWPLKE